MVLLDPIGRIMDGCPSLKDIGMSGARIVTVFPFVVGETIRFSLRLAGGATATGFAKVRWAAAGADGRELGIEFVDFGWGGQESLQAVLEPRAAIKALLGSSGFERWLDNSLLIACMIVTVGILRAMTYGTYLPTAHSRPGHSFLAKTDPMVQFQRLMSGNER